MKLLPILLLALLKLKKNGAVSMDYRELEQKYYELLLAVVHKFPGESRHQTALRYIRETEERGSWVGSDAKSSEKE